MAEFITDPIQYRKKKIEDLLWSLETDEGWYRGAVDSGDQSEIDHWGKIYNSSKTALKEFGIDANTYLEAIDQYALIKQSWEQDKQPNIAAPPSIQREWAVFCDTRRQQDTEAYLESQNLLGTPATAYSLQQKAEIRRVENYWEDLKRKNVS